MTNRENQIPNLKCQTETCTFLLSFLPIRSRNICTPTTYRVPNSRGLGGVQCSSSFSPLRIINCPHNHSWPVTIFFSLYHKQGKSHSGRSNQHVCHFNRQEIPPMIDIKQYNRCLPGADRAEERNTTSLACGRKCGLTQPKMVLKIWNCL